MEVLKWIMETTEPKAHGIHLKMWERQRSQALDHRNITLQVNEYAIVLSDMELLLWVDDNKLTPLLSVKRETTLQWGTKDRREEKDLKPFCTVCFCRCTPLHRVISEAASPLAQCSQHRWNRQTGLDFLCVVFSFSTMWSVIPPHLPRYLKIGCEHVSESGAVL